jgi:hypothetical protein
MSPVRAELVPHPGNPQPALDIRIAASVERTARGCDFRYEVTGRVAEVVWPAAGAPQRRDGLWRHTCFEAFCAVPRGSTYYEFNFSPSAAWAAYRFGGYRERLADPELAAAPAIHLWRGDLEARLDVTLDIEGLPRVAQAKPLDLALSAVIESRDGGIHHYALAHPAEAADFHDRRGFVLTLAGYGGPAS